MTRLFILLVLATPYLQAIAQEAIISRDSIQFATAVLSSSPNNDEQSLNFSNFRIQIPDKDFSKDYRPFLNSLCKLTWSGLVHHKLNLNVELTRDVKYGAGVGLLYRMGKRKCCKARL